MKTKILSLIFGLFISYTGKCQFSNIDLSVYFGTAHHFVSEGNKETIERNHFLLPALSAQIYYNLNPRLKLSGGLYYLQEKYQLLSPSETTWGSDFYCFQEYGMSCSQYLTEVNLHLLAMSLGLKQALGHKVFLQGEVHYGKSLTSQTNGSYILETGNQVNDIRWKISSDRFEESLEDRINTKLGILYIPFKDSGGWNKLSISLSSIIALKQVNFEHISVTTNPVSFWFGFHWMLFNGI